MYNTLSWASSDAHRDALDDAHEVCAVCYGVFSVDDPGFDAHERMCSLCEADALEADLRDDEVQP